ncbi:hypothetical protein GCM10010279_00120 [Streptomyces mutabilis]|nr:hypothetical protein GCM10010279_00120 [Streptomyces mutabilis]
MPPPKSFPGGGTVVFRAGPPPRSVRGTLCKSRLTCVEAPPCALPARRDGRIVSQRQRPRGPKGPLPKELP